MTTNDQHVTREINHRLVPLTGNYIFDPVHTFFGFSAQHLVVGRVRGRFDAIEGRLMIAEDLLASKVEVTVESASLNTLMPMRDEDLRSARYLDVVTYPKITFRNSAITELADGRWGVHGDLTIRDVSKPIELLVHFRGATVDAAGRMRIAFNASGSIARKDFGLTSELLTEAGSLLVGRDISLDLDIEATITTDPSI